MKGIISKPFKSYYGGKNGSGTYQQIINHIPKCDVFIDAMVGNGGIVTNLSLPGLTVINDVDRSVIDAYDVASCTGIKKYNLDYSVIIKMFGGAKGVCFYFDPPYLFSTRKSQKPLYKNEWTEDQHVKFLSMASTVKGFCMISHYPCELYDKMLAGWHTHDYESMTRSGQRTERLYMNFPKPIILQDFRYIGNDYRERQRIKRKIERHINKLESLPDMERTAILSSITVKYSATAANFLPSELIDIISCD